MLGWLWRCVGASTSDLDEYDESTSTTTTTPAPPARVLVVGDSLSILVGLALEDIAPQHNLVVRNEGVRGCGILRGTGVRYGRANPTGSICSNWPERFRAALEEFQPDHVVVLDGYWDAFDWYLDGEVVPFGTPEWDAFATWEFGEAMDVLASTGAQVLWLDAPYYSLERPDPTVSAYFARTGEYRSAYDDDRVRHLNDVFHRAIAPRWGRVLPVDFRKVVCPGDDYVGVIDGVEIRNDGVHFTGAGAARVAEWLSTEFLRSRSLVPSCPLFGPSG